jgi:hypothetical protein
MHNQRESVGDAATRQRIDAHPPARFTEQELRRIFKRMADDEVRDVPLPYRRRRKLMRYAAQIGIDAFEASLMIAQAEREAGHHDDMELLPADDIAPLIHPERWPIWFKLTAALMIAILVQIIAIRALGW